MYSLYILSNLARLMTTGKSANFSFTLILFVFQDSNLPYFSLNENLSGAQTELSIHRFTLYLFLGS